MAELGYLDWGFIAVDDDPSTGVPSSFKPPMISTMAVDLQTSLIFQLSASIPTLVITIESTALSADQSGASFFDVYTGPQPGNYQLRQHSGWELHLNGLYAQFTTQIQRPETYIKLNYTLRQNLIIAKVEFSQP